MIMEETKPNSWTIPVHDRVFAVEFSPFNWCGSLLAIGTRNRIIVGICTFPEEKDNNDSLLFENLKEFHHGTRVDAIAWSPHTSLALVPRKILRFVSAGGDRKLRIFNSDIRISDNVELVEGHTDFINSVAFEPNKGDQIASASDDHTCRIWGVDGSKQASFALQSPGMSVLWHKDEPGKLLVAEKNGIIRFYNVITQQPIMSLDSVQPPLTSVDWNPVNSLKVGCTTSTKWSIWDTSRSSRPIESQSVHSEIAQHFRWCSTNENLIATLGRPNNQIKVFHIKSKQVCLDNSLPIIGGLTWHYKLPIVAVGGDRKVHFWVIEGY